jgi:KDO2-lipid IV(A) lauroyltransferase
MLTRLGLGIIWLLHLLPLGLLAALGRGLGRLFYRLARRRRNIALTNLRLCFPHLTERERRDLAKSHFAVFARSLLERGILWWAPEQRIRSLGRIEGEEHLAAAAGTPVILLTPHFVGMDMGWTRLTCDHHMVGVYANQKNIHFNAALLKGRERFGKSEVLSRQAGIRPAIRALQSGLPFYYLPDMDYGQRDTIFVPFFGYPAATITGVSRLARMCGAKVIPCVTKMLDGGDGYVVKLYPAWDNFPGPDIESDTRRMNAFIEERVLEMPEQYYWVHRRFKTRPPGENKPY